MVLLTVILLFFVVVFFIVFIIVLGFCFFEVLGIMATGEIIFSIDL